jgi:acetyltransferase-like isoleucine patch superfamily enzyme
LSSPIELGPVVIEDDCDLGVGAIVLPGVRIGKGAQIGAGAVVAQDVPPYSVAIGVPARVTRERPE